MRILAIVLLAATLTACGTSVQTASEDQVSIRFHNYADSPDSLQPIAEEQCASYDRIAIYRDTTLGEGTIGFLTGLPITAEFECRVPTEF